jgi:catechol 2,3-dioxygenase-like lactoylglutathione lyase family enzyme
MTQPSTPSISPFFIVTNVAQTIAFYRDTLGFHVYWQGGMQPGRTDWCSMNSFRKPGGVLSASVDSLAHNLAVAELA